MRSAPTAGWIVSPSGSSLTTTETPSQIPATNNAATEITKTSETPKAMIATPNPAIARCSASPARARGGCRTATSIANSAPPAIAARMIPTPCAPHPSMSANTGNNPATAQLRALVAPHRLICNNTKLRSKAS